MAGGGDMTEEEKRTVEHLRWHIAQMETLRKRMVRLMVFQSCAFIATCVLNLFVFWIYGASWFAYASQMLAIAAIAIIIFNRPLPQ